MCLVNKTLYENIVKMSLAAKNALVSKTKKITLYLQRSCKQSKTNLHTRYIIKHSAAKKTI